MVKADEVFVSDGSKCDIGRLQIVFGQNATVAVQDPAYPVYVDSSVIFGRSGKLNEVVQRPWFPWLLLSTLKRYVESNSHRWCEMCSSSLSFHPAIEMPY
jgi:aspartate/methionine/tyrosine aminotransferase